MKWLGLGLAAALAVQAQNPDYKNLHNLLVKFYGFQRAGDKVINNKNPFYKTSPYPHSQDASGSNDLSGGWYDAGDFVKFGLPFGFATYCLLKGYDVFPKGYDDLDSWDYTGTPDKIPDILGEVKIATDYMIKAVISSSQVVTDVGNAGSDHGDLGESGYANSQRTSPRVVYSATGADVAGLDAASLALMSIVYKPYDAAYSTKCLTKAQDAYKFGIANKKLSTEQNNGEFYKTTKWEDKMACAALELFRATKDSTYLTQAKTFLGAVGSHYFVLSYGYLGDLAYFELKRQTGANVEGPWFTDVTSYMTRKVAATGPALIRGAFINSTWGNAGNAGCAGFSAALAFLTTGDSKYLDFARSQAHWVAGLSPSTQSYVIGFGNGPTAPHHRNDNTLGKQNGTRLKGGVVSGPRPSDAGSFDAAHPEKSTWVFNPADMNDFQTTEPAINYNAGMIGLVAFLRDYDNPPAGLVRITEALKVTPGNVDLNVGSGIITGKLETAMAWKLVLVGQTSQAKRTIAGTAAAISVEWKGEADAGTFQVGEQITVTLDVANIAEYHKSRASTAFYLTGGKKEEFKTTDILVDDFEDGDAINAFKGNWSIFTDATLGGTSVASPASLATAIVAKEGESATKGLAIRFVGDKGAAHPNVGVKTTFNATNAAVSLGKASGFVFDIKAAVGDSLWVELEQSDIADSAYFQKKMTFASTNWVRMRIPFASLVQPSWKKTAATLNTGKIVSVRFTNYGTGTLRFNLDNLRIESLEIGGSPIRNRPNGRRSLSVSAGTVQATPQGLVYDFLPPAVSGNWHVDISDVFGRQLISRDLGSLQGQSRIQLADVKLAPGWYFLRHQRLGQPGEWIQRIRIGQ